MTGAGQAFLRLQGGFFHIKVGAADYLALGNSPIATRRNWILTIDSVTGPTWFAFIPPITR